MKIGIVNDLKLALEILKRVVSTIPGATIAWTAEDGQEAIAKHEKDPADLILMDLIMPVMDGVEATKKIMLTNPCAILIVTASVEGNSSKVYEALGNGALDAIRTPEVGLNNKLSGSEELAKKIWVLGRLIKDKGHEVLLSEQSSSSAATSPQLRPPLLVIGASTGGPQALLEILSSLPKNFSLPVIIIQHVNKEFAEGLAEWLNNKSALPVRAINSGDTPEKGFVYIAATDDHLVLGGDNRFYYRTKPLEHPYRPSVDVFFNSLLDSPGPPGIAVILTGMGRDGGQGLKVLRSRGYKTIAQDQQTSVVYGMPRYAAQLDAANYILPLGEIAQKIVYLSKEVNRA